MKKTHSSLPVSAMQLAMIYESNGCKRPWINLEQIVLKFHASFPSTHEIGAGWAAVVARHAALRSVFQWQNVEQPRQRILDAVSVTVDEQDWSGQSADARKGCLQHTLEEDRKRGVSLDGRPGWRVMAARTSENSGFVIVTIHHALVDGRSMAQILTEFLQYLETGAITAKIGTDYQRVLSEITRSDSQGEAEEFFAQYLDGFDTIGDLSLPVSDDLRALPEPSSSRKALLTARIDRDLTSNLEQRCQESGTTLANFVQAAWGVVLARWQGQAEVAFGAARSGRFAVPDSQNTVGCLINTLPMRVKLTRDRTLADLVQGLRRDTCAMHGFEQTQPRDLRQWGGLDGHQPLFSSVVMFERGTLEDLVYAGYQGSLRPEIRLHEEGGLPLSLAVYGTQALDVVLEYAPDVVGASVARLLLDHFQNLLAAMSSASLDTPIGALDMMTPQERTQLLSLAKPQTPVTTTPKDIMARFQDQVARRGDQVAVVPLNQPGQAPAVSQAHGPLGGLSFKQLDQQANGLAHVLKGQGVGPGGMVAISLERSPEFVVAMLAVLKLGASFVPVDPTYPDAQQLHMIRDSGACLIVARQNGGEAHKGVARIHPVAAPAEHPPQVDPVAQDAVAYVIYTSGSTGTPKGVAVTRNNFAAYVEALIPAYRLTPEDRVLQFASLSFDVALEEVFPTLLSGATLVLRDIEMAQSPAIFMDRLEAEKISVANLPTAFWTVLTDYLAEHHRQVPESLRLMIVGGELVKPTALQKWQHVAPKTRWMNGYGPTEATITCTLYEARSVNTGTEVPIGRPTGHALTYVLAEDGSLAPQGGEGELAIGGPAVAQGYIGLSDQTGAVFRKDPFQGQGRIYFTGDRVKWAEDRNLMFHGRKDRQVKLRGFRIDLRHIERAVENLLPAAQAVVQVLDQDQPTAFLVAWVKMAEGLDRDALSEALSQVLPGYMLPKLVMVDDFPTTAGGKIDLKSLPRPSNDGTSPKKTKTALPETDLERQVRAVMARVLGRPSVSVTDDFFDLGGHSLMAFELLGRLGALTGQQLGVIELQENPTPRGLARILETGSSRPKHIIPIQPLGNRPPLFAVHILGARKGFFGPLSKYLGTDQPIMGVSVGALDENTPTGIEFTAKRYCADIMQYYPDGPINLMAVSLGSYMAFELARQLQAAGREVALLALFDAAGPEGRDEYQGLRRIWAHVKRARYLGWTFPAQVIHNRLHDLRNHFARKQLQEAAAQGEGQAPMSVFEFIASNELAVQAYSPSALKVPLTIFRAESHFYDTPKSIETGLGWASVADSGFEVHDVPGGHLSMLEEPNVAVLALHLMDALEAQQRSRLSLATQGLHSGQETTRTPGVKKL